MAGNSPITSPSPSPSPLLPPSRLFLLATGSLLLQLLNISAFAASVNHRGGGVQELKVGVVLDLGSMLGKVSLTSINLAVSDFYAGHPNATRRLVLHIRDSMGDAVGAASAAIDLLTNEQVQAIVGPQTSDEALFLADLGSKSHVPIFSFSATSPCVSPAQNPYFIRGALNDADQAKPIADFIKAFGWRRVVLIYEDTSYGNGPVPFLVDAFSEAKSRVSYRCVIQSEATDVEIYAELYKLMSMQTRVFVVHMGGSLGFRLFSLAEKAGMMANGYVWIITDGLSSLLDSTDSPDDLGSMHGVIGVKPYIEPPSDLRNFKNRWKREFLRANPEHELSEPNMDGLRAYDTVLALALTAEKISGYAGISSSRDSTSDLASVGTSAGGQELLDVILRTKFDGKAGKFQLSKGELHAPGYMVVNVIDGREREVGFWTPKGGLSRRRNPGNKQYSTSKEDLRPIIWPGEPDAVPRGWVEPISEKKMRIGVPAECGFDSIMKVRYDSMNRTIVSGYVIEVFEAAVKGLPYAISFEYVPFEGHYDDLVKQVYYQTLDAVVGDVTITWNRSQYVDFTMPFTQRGVAMIVPTRYEGGNRGWIFLKPLVLELWLAAGAFFVFTGFVILFLEHRINPEFRGPPAQHIGAVFYFSFSTLVFAHRERVFSNLTRVVVIVWLFVVLILTSSYTASLASMFTVRKLVPRVASIDEIRNNGEQVGYPRDSFVQGVLRGRGFRDDRLKAYLSPQEYAAALAMGTSNGGVAAVIDEIPYLKVFLKQYCSNYTMTSMINNTAGLGFAFPKGSPLVGDLSRSLLNLTNDNTISEIQRRWFGDDQDGCPAGNTTTDLSLNVLDFQSFWGLFLITGAASTTSLVAYAASFLYTNRHVLGEETSGLPPWQRFLAVLRHFNHPEPPPAGRPPTPRENSENPRDVEAAPTDGEQTPSSVVDCYPDEYRSHDSTSDHMFQQEVESTPPRDTVNRQR